MQQNKNITIHRFEDCVKKVLTFCKLTLRPLKKVNENILYQTLQTL